MICTFLMVNVIMELFTSLDLGSKEVTRIKTGLQPAVIIGQKNGSRLLIIREDLKNVWQVFGKTL